MRERQPSDATSADKPLTYRDRKQAAANRLPQVGQAAAPLASEWRLYRR